MQPIVCEVLVSKERLLTQIDGCKPGMREVFENVWGMWFYKPVCGWQVKTGEQSQFQQLPVTVSDDTASSTQVLFHWC